MALTAGTMAPDFSLVSKTDEGISAVSLSNALQNGPVALLFFPAAFTGVCTEELCDKSGGLGAVSTLGVQVFGVSPDAVFAQEAWAKASGISVQLLSDYQREATHAYDVVWDDFAGMGPGTARAVFLIGTDGEIKYSEQTATLGDLPDFDALKVAAEAL